MGAAAEAVRTHRQGLARVKRRRVQIVALCEDKQQEFFVRHFLLAMGWGKKRWAAIRYETSPSGKGAASGWVLQSFPKELQYYRQHKNKVASALIVMIDADNQRVETRIKSLEDHCTRIGLPFRTQEEAVAIAVPKRNIETWIAYLEGCDVDEGQDYKAMGKAMVIDCRSCISNLASACKAKALPPGAPDSLAMACREYRTRIVPMQDYP